ncbi:hypothetical protein F5Y17DRAFT_425602 [Xylariaceae sp. FL0594]|nr:hypothetical protein F5Y17DRAFT_425602 [Xylariaceae sp. FL0594]
MNISRIDGTRYGAVLLSLPVLAATRPRATARVRDGGSANELHSSPWPTRQAKQARKPNNSLPSLPTPANRFFDTNVASPASRLLSSSSHKSGSSQLVAAKSTNHGHSAPSTHESPAAPAQPHVQSTPRSHVVVPVKTNMRDFIDYYDDDPVDEYLRFYNDTFLRRYAPADGPHLVISNKKEDLEVQTVSGDSKRQVVQRLTGDSRVDVLMKYLWNWRRKPAAFDLDTVWDLYQNIPEPRPTRMPHRVRHELLAALASVERKDHKSMLKYFAVIADTKECGLALTQSEWNTAMAFTARYVNTTTEAEVEAVLQLWGHMQREANMKADQITFNILFNTAAKAGKFALAEMTFQEMTRRGIQYDRYDHTALIHFFGLQKDSAGVRVAYRAMVEAGEIIDTLVLNCVIASLLKCGEEVSAEYVFEKMKASNRDLAVVPHRDRTMAKAMTAAMKMFGKLAKQYSEMLPHFQSAALTVPDLNTFRILIHHYGEVLGDYSKVVRLLDEMKYFSVPLHQCIFQALFKSYARHGHSTSDWNARSLQKVWGAFLSALDSNADSVGIDRFLAIGILNAHSRFASRNEMLDVYEALRSRWCLDDDDTIAVFQHLAKLLNRPTKLANYSWTL